MISFTSNASVHLRKYVRHCFVCLLLQNSSKLFLNACCQGLLGVSRKHHTLAYPTQRTYWTSHLETGEAKMCLQIKKWAPWKHVPQHIHGNPSYKGCGQPFWRKYTFCMHSGKEVLKMQGVMMVYVALHHTIAV